MTTLLTTMRQRLADAEDDATRLRAAIQILERAESAPTPTGTAGAPAATREPRRRTSARNGKPKAAKTVVPLEKLLVLVGENPGLTTTALARQTGGDQSTLLELLKESEQKGEVRREGQRRATSWFRITDEDRIAARAAELAARATSAAKPRKAAAGPGRAR